jgi:hypothetical protein
MHINLSIGGSQDGQVVVYLLDDPLDPTRGRSDEPVVEYCQNSLRRMKQAVEEIYGLCVNELGSGGESNETL